MGDEKLKREEDERYREIDRVIDKADVDASETQSDDQDRDLEKNSDST
jgi:hypothetical protein